MVPLRYRKTSYGTTAPVPLRYRMESRARRGPSGTISGTASGTTAESPRGESESHAGGLMGNFGREKTLLMLDDHFYWPKMRRDVDRYEEGASIARREEEQLDKKMDMKLDMELDKKTSHGRAREEREACARGDVPAGA
ncbi:hypothetical protein QYE76_015428 [Lolium multiflorum]|uniref:Integrase zinc-binding domain-containing protein n=1 Tax=Lolium multiflorum TaxID=4521 RepID=A0AAD8X6R9_LOLMU|nr:hypothetical protein QYE76_015428 [Lolium multiflorum]